VQSADEKNYAQSVVTMTAPHCQILLILRQHRVCLHTICNDRSEMSSVISLRAAIHPIWVIAQPDYVQCFAARVLDCSLPVSELLHMLYASREQYHNQFSSSKLQYLSFVVHQYIPQQRAVKEYRTQPHESSFTLADAPSAAG